MCNIKHVVRPVTLVRRVIVFFFLLSPSAFAISLFTDYNAMTPEQSVNYWQKKQIDKYDDPIVNYNLGVALYKAGQFDSAKQNFQRTLDYGLDNKSDAIKLRAKTYFNSGNCFYKNCLGILGPDWEKEEKIDDKKLERAINEIKGAIEKYKNVLVLDKENEPAQNNLKLAEELLKKLEQKKQQQDQKQDKQDKQDKQNQDQKQDKQDEEQKQDKNHQQDKQDQDQNEDKEHNHEKIHQNKSDQGKNDKQEKQDKKQDQKDQQDKQDKQNQHKNGQDKKDKREQEQKQEQQPSGAPAGGKEEEKEESSARRGMRAILENLEDDESKLQKALIYQNMKGTQEQEQAGQKPW